MSLRKLSRLVVHMAVVLAMVLAGAVAPAVATTSALESLSPAAPTAAMNDMPCDDMAGMVASEKAPAAPDAPCITHHCDLSACLGIACLPELPRLSGSLHAESLYARVDVAAIPAGVADTPLRPPNA